MPKDYPTREELAARMNAARMPDRQRVIARFLRRDEFYVDDGVYEAFGWKDGAALADAFPADGDAYRVVADFFGRENAAMARRLWERVQNYPYTEKYESLPFSQADDVARLTLRSARYGSLYIRKAVRVVHGFVAFLIGGGDIFACLAAPDPAMRTTASVRDETFPQILGCFLDEGDGDGRLSARVREVIADRMRFKAGGELSAIGHLVGGLFCSHGADNHRFAVDLLLDGRLPERYRRDILLEVRHGVREAFLHCVNAVAHHPLAGSASMRLALREWLGLDFVLRGDSAALYSWLEKHLPAPPGFAALRSDQPMMVYMGLWALGDTGVEFALDACADMARNGTRGQKIAALSYAGRLNDRTFQFRIALPILECPGDRADPVLTALVVQCLTRWADGPSLGPRRNAPPGTPKYFDRPGAVPTAADSDVLLTTKDEIRRAFHALAAAAEAFPLPGAAEIGGRFAFPDDQCVVYSRNDLYAVMIDLLRRPRDDSRRGYDPQSDPNCNAARDWGFPLPVRPPAAFALMRDDWDDEPEADNLRNELCRHWPDMNGEMRKRRLMWAIGKDAEGEKQRAALIDAFSVPKGEMKPQPMLPQAALFYTAELELTDAEYRRLEGFLRDAMPESRMYILMRLLRRDPKGLGETVGRLVAADDAGRRTAGLELLAVMGRKRSDPRYGAIHAECLRAAGPGASAEVVPGADDGFGLFDPAAPIPHFAIDGVPDLTAADIDQILFPVTGEELLAFHNALYAVGAREDLVVEPEEAAREFREREWRALFERLRPTPACVVLYFRLTSLSGRFTRAGGDAVDPDMLWLEDVAWCRAFQERSRDVFVRMCELLDSLASSSKSAPFREYAVHVRDAARLAPAEPCYEILRRIALAFMKLDIGLIDPAKLAGRRTTSSGQDTAAQFVDDWLRGLKPYALRLGDAGHADCFKLAYEWSYGPGGRGPVPARFDVDDIALAHRLGLLPENELIRHIVLCLNGGLISAFTDSASVASGKLLAADPGLRDLVRRIVERVVDVETRRGDLPTPMTNLALRVWRFEGSERFAAIVERYGDEPFVPAGRLHLSDDGGGSRSHVLSRLLHCCHPRQGEGVEELRRALAGRPITASRLRDAARVAPQWEDLVKEYLGAAGD